MAQFPFATVNAHNSSWKVVKVTSREKLSGPLCTHTHTHGCIAKRRHSYPGKIGIKDQTRA